MIDWFRQLQGMLQTENRLVIVSVASAKGSTPREPGARMLVSENRVSLTIGGGHLEFKAIQLARNMLTQNLSNELHRFSLGATLGQCCGGVVTLLFEVVSDQSAWLQDIKSFMLENRNFVQVIPLSSDNNDQRLMVTADTAIPECCGNNSLISTARNMLETAEKANIKRIENREYVFDTILVSDLKVYLFGAGHVGEAIVKQLAEQPCIVHWIDTRDGQLPETTAANVTAICTGIPDALIDEASAGSYFLVMTHDHQLDQALAEQILKRDDYEYFGLIGSATKRKKFEHRLSHRGITERQLSRMICPIGIGGIKSKHPAAIALAVTAEIIQCYELSKNKLQDFSQQDKLRETKKL